MQNSSRPELRRNILKALCVAGLLNCFASVCSAAPADSRLAAVKSFAFGIGDGALKPAALAKLASHDLVVIDGEGATAEQIQVLHDQGAIVLGYLSVGTIEKDRSWFAKVKKFRLELWEDWGEWYTATSKPGFRSVILSQVAPVILAKGFDGLFLDNVDMVIDHRTQRSGMFRLVQDLSTLVHADGKYLFAQNGFPLLKSIGPYLDGWNREDVSLSYDFDRRKYVSVDSRTRAQNIKELRQASSKGLLALGTDYLPANSTKGARALQLTCGAGAIPYLSDIFLRRIPAVPVVCSEQP